MMNELIVASICAGISTHAMCSKALEAAGKQSGVYQTIETAEKKIKDITRSEIESALWHKIYNILTYSVVAGKIGSGGAGSVRVNGGSICDSVTFVGAKKAGSVEFKWNF